MSDLFKKGIFLGLGAALSGKEKAEKMLDELVKKGDISNSQANEMLQSFIDKGEAKNNEWNNQTKTFLKKNLEELGFVTKEEFEKLENRLKNLEAKHSDE